MCSQHVLFKTPMWKSGLKKKNSRDVSTLRLNGSYVQTTLIVQLKMSVQILCFTTLRLAVGVDRSGSCLSCNTLLTLCQNFNSGCWKDGLEGYELQSNISFRPIWPTITLWFNVPHYCLLNVCISSCLFKWRYLGLQKQDNNLNNFM